MNTYNQKLRNRLTAYLRTHRKSELAKASGLSYTTVDTIVKGEGEMHYSSACALIAAMDGKKVRRSNPETDAA